MKSSTLKVKTKMSVELATSKLNEYDNNNIKPLVQKETNHFKTLFKFNNKKSIYDNFIAFYCIAKAFSYAGFTIPNSIISDEIRIRKSDFLITLIYTFMNIMMAIITFKIDTSASESLLLNLGNKIIIISGLAITAPVSCSNVFNRNRFWKIIQLLDFADSEMFKYGIKINYRSHHMIIIFYIIIQTTLLVSYILAVIVYPWRENSEINIKKSVVLFYCYGYILVLLIGFLGFISCIYTRLCALNDCIIYNFNLTNHNITFVTPKNMEKVVRDFGITYHKINEAIDLINFCFCLQVMLCFGLFFGFTVFTLFGAYRWSNHYSKNELFYVLENVIWNGIFFNLIITIVVFGDYITSEGRKTAILLHKALSSRVQDLETAENLIFMSQQIRHRLPVISCGLFEFDWTLFYSMAAALTTYIVVLIQFDDTLK